MIEITKENFKEISSQDKLVLIDFWAEWCGPCKIYTPIIEEISKQFGEEIVVGKLDCENHKEVASELGIRSIPTTLFFKGGKEVLRKTGVLQKNQLETLINENK